MQVWAVFIRKICAILCWSTKQNDRNDKCSMLAYLRSRLILSWGSGPGLEFRPNRNDPD
jgi:hypothetical protein